MKRDMARAIQYFCAECVGYDTGYMGDIKACTCPYCPLYPFRLGRDPSPDKKMESYKLAVTDFVKMRKLQKRDAWNSMVGVILDITDGNDEKEAADGIQDDVK